MVLAVLFLCDQLMAALYNHCSLLTTRKLASHDWVSSFFSPPTLRHTSVHCWQTRPGELVTAQVATPASVYVCHSDNSHMIQKRSPPCLQPPTTLWLPQYVSDPNQHHHYRMLAGSVMLLCDSVRSSIFIWKHLIVNSVPRIFMSWSSKMACRLARSFPIVDGYI